MESSGSSQNLVSLSGFQIPQYILDDLCARFVINLPEEESRDPIRVFFQIELAHWFYLDFYCPENSQLRTCSIKDFSTQVFRHCPSLAKHVDNFDSILESWKEYKLAVPTYGAILLDPTLQYCLLVQGYWVKASWGFPKGKVNQDEQPMECAIREVLEETGFDIRGMINPNEYLEFKMNEQLSRLYIITGVPRDTKFQARTRNEIKNFEWFRVEHLPAQKKDANCKQHTGLGPNSFFMVIPFIKNLRRWIGRKSGASDTPFSDVNEGSTDITGGRQGVSKVEPKAQVLTQESRLRQKQQFAQQMQLEFEEYVGHRESKKAAAASASPVRLRDGRQETVSPRRPPVPSSSSARKQVQILKRDNTKSVQQRNTASDMATSGVSVTDQNSRDSGGFVCQSWNNFHLDIDAVLGAMFPSKSSDVSQASGRTYPLVS